LEEPTVNLEEDYAGQVPHQQRSYKKSSSRRNGSQLHQNTRVEEADGSGTRDGRGGDEADDPQ